jgi:hypothetical protein
MLGWSPVSRELIIKIVFSSFLFRFFRQIKSFQRRTETDGARLSADHQHRSGVDDVVKTVARFGGVVKADGKFLGVVKTDPKFVDVFNQQIGEFPKSLFSLEVKIEALPTRKTLQEKTCFQNKSKFSTEDQFVKHEHYH